MKNIVTIILILIGISIKSQTKELSLYGVNNDTIEPRKEYKILLKNKNNSVVISGCGTKLTNRLDTFSFVCNSEGFILISVYKKNVKKPQLTGPPFIFFVKKKTP